MMRMFAIVNLFAALLLLVSGCGDFGSDLPDTMTPSVSAVQPDSGGIGDTVRLFGAEFGSTRGSGVVRFGNIDAQTYSLWTDTLIVTAVPQNSTTSAITVIVGTRMSIPMDFKVLGAVRPIRSFSLDILPRLSQYGCMGCHGGSGGLYLDTQPHILQGGSHGPVVVPGDAVGSLLIQKMSANPPFGSRMPQGGPFLADSAMQVFVDWISQGALDN